MNLKTEISSLRSQPLGGIAFQHLQFTVSHSELQSATAGLRSSFSESSFSCVKHEYCVLPSFAVSLHHANSYEINRRTQLISLVFIVQFPSFAVSLQRANSYEMNRCTPLIKIVTPGAAARPSPRS